MHTRFVLLTFMASHLASSDFLIPMSNKCVHVVGFYNKNMFSKHALHLKGPSLCEDPMVDHMLTLFGQVSFRLTLINVMNNVNDNINVNYHILVLI